MNLQNRKKWANEEVWKLPSEKIKEKHFIHYSEAESGTCP